ncbi:MAG: DnaD domain protein [Oscillospiraceae bacterium]|nr:DnaD domain protein [Oscillospiraceae bacterium]
MEFLTIEEAVVRKLLGAASGDAALLYLYIHSGAEIAAAEKALGFTQTRMSCAAATLRQLGLWPEERKTPILPGERPSYSEKDVLDAMDGDKSFRLLYGEVQRLMGRSLNTEELKILLSFVRYLGLPSEVISVLVSYCKERARRRGSLRNPSLRTIEKEAYSWAEQGIDTLEEAAAYIHNQSVRNSKLQQLMAQLQIRGRSLTQAEEKYASSWLEMDFEDGVIALAYEKTCVNTGGLSWPYMNKILNSWHTAGYKTAEQIRNGDRKKDVPKGASGELGEAEMEAIRRLLQEG